MRTCRSAVLLAVLGMQVAGSAAVAAQRPPVVHGRIIDSTNSPIAFAQIRGPGVDPRISDEAGQFRFTMREAGALALEIRRVGFLPVQVEASVGADTILTIVMQPVAASLRTVRIDAEAAVRSLSVHGFYDRLSDHLKGTNTGWFIMPEEIEARRGASRVTQLVQGIPNLKVLRIMKGGGNGFDTLVGPGGCPMMIYIDGVRVNQLGGGVLAPADFDYMVTARDLAGVEVYTHANAPSQYMSFALNCGVVLFWTK